MISTPYHNYDLYEYIMTGYFSKKTKDMIIYDVCLAPLPTTEMPKASKAVPSGWMDECPNLTRCIKEEGKTPMRYNDNYASASVSTIAVKSDAASQRDYLEDRLESATYPKQKELEKLFNLFVDNTPKTYKQFIDAIKNDKFKIDPKIAKKIELAENEGDSDILFWGPLYGIIFDGPQSDPDGYRAAYSQMKKQKMAARDTIMSGVYADGLKALQDFEAWLPTPATTIQ